MFLTINSGCKDNPVWPISPSLIGSWNWVKSVGGIMGGYFTPQTEKHTRTIIFTPDSVCKQYLDDSLVNSPSFTVRQQNISDGSKVEMIFYPEPNPAQIITRLDDDTLIVTDYVDDGFTSTFNRIK
jgi:hypothetical protein